MNEIEKMYSNADVETLSYCCDGTHGEPTKKCKGCLDYREIYPPFTAEKQLELIKWLGRNKNGFGFFNDGTKFLSCHCDFQCEWFDNYSYAEDFGNALAGLVNTLWQDLTEEEKKQIREILK